MKRSLVIIALLLAACSPSNKFIRSRVVKLVSDKGSCSGEQVKAPSGVSYILTAAHCRVLEKDGQIIAQTESGHSLPRRVIAEDGASDLLLLEGLPGVEGLEIARSAPANTLIRTFTHGHGFDTYETAGVLVQEFQVLIPISMIYDDASKAACVSQAKYKAFETVFGTYCVMDVAETVTTAFISPGSSGGPVVDGWGRLVGVVSAGGEGYGFLVRLSDIRKFIGNY